MGSGTLRGACGQVGVTRPAEATADPWGVLSMGWREKGPGRRRSWVRQGHVGSIDLIWGKRSQWGPEKRWEPSDIG